MPKEWRSGYGSSWKTTKMMADGNYSRLRVDQEKLLIVVSSLSTYVSRFLLFISFVDNAPHNAEDEDLSGAR